MFHRVRSQRGGTAMAASKPSAASETDETMSTCSLTESIDDDARNLSAPKGFLCPLTMEILYDPVLDAEGNTYERSAIMEWLQNHHTSPISRQPLSEHILKPNNSLRDAIHECMGDDWTEQRSLHHKRVERSSQPRQNSLFRERINCFLQMASREVGGLPTELNEHGCCAFRHDSITMVIDVPESAGVFCLYTRSLVSELTEPMKDLLLEMNFLQGDTRGGCLSVKRNNVGQTEVMFSYTDRVTEINARDFVHIITNFAETAVVVRKKLHKAGNQSTPK